MEAKKEDFIVNLNDLVPQEAHFKLSSTGDKVHTLKPYSLRVQLWAAKKFGAAEVERALNMRDASVLSTIAFEVLKDKTTFPTYEDFLEAVVTFTDRENVLAAIFETVGMSQPALEKIASQIEAKNKSGNEPSAPQTGANSSTQLEVPTPTTQV